MGGGSVSSETIDPRKAAQEKKTIGNWYGFQQNQLGNYVSESPLLSAANSGALGFYGKTPGLINPLMKILGSEPGQFDNLRREVAGFEAPFKGAMDQINPVLESGGSLPPELLRNAQQQQLGLESMAGTAHTTPGLARTVLESEAEREKRFANYLGLAQNATGALSGLVGQQAGLIGQKASTTQGLASGVQGLQTGGLNQLLGTQGANVSTFTGLENPILGYLGNLFGQNLQARIAQSQINAQLAQGNQSASAGKAGGAMSSVGSIVGAVLPLLAASDERVKRKIRDTGMTSKEGVPLKTFEYRTRPGVVMLGVLSKDVKARVPSAVTKDPVSGIEFVDTRQFPIFELSATRKAA